MNRFEGWATDRVMGFYDACSLILTSPRVNKPAREVIKDLGLDAVDELKKKGIKFEGSGS